MTRCNAKLCWQVFSARGLSTASITGDQNDSSVANGVSNGTYRLVFFTPEMLLLKKKWRLLLTSSRYQENLKALIVDEAHVVKNWKDLYCF